MKARAILFAFVLFWIFIKIFPLGKDTIMGIGSVVIMLILMEPCWKANGKDIYK